MTADPTGAHLVADTDLAADSVSYRRGERTVLDRVTLRARAGEVTAIVGPSGSGKSTLLSLLAGLEMPDEGTIVRPYAPAETGLVLQAYGLASLLTAAENVETPLQTGKHGRLSPAAIRRKAATALDLVGLGSVADHLAEELSGGQQQRIAIARALVIEPRLLLADEFTAELDHASRSTAVELVFGVAHRGGTVVIATHDPQIVGRCDRVVLLESGRQLPPGADAAGGSLST